MIHGAEGELATKKYTTRTGVLPERSAGQNEERERVRKRREDKREWKKRRNKERESPRKEKTNTRAQARMRALKREEGAAPGERRRRGKAARDCVDTGAE